MLITFAFQLRFAYMSIPTLFSAPPELFIQSGISSAQYVFYQLPPETLIQQAVEKGEGTLSDTGALVIDTGEFTGRSPKDKFIVIDDLTRDTIDWNEFNIPIEPKYFERLYAKAMAFLEGKKLWVRDCIACANREYNITIRVINENPCCNLFVYNMFLRPDESKLSNIEPDWHLIQVPHFYADPSEDGTRSKAFVITNFSRKVILIGGTQYTGEMKKSVFSILNFLLPQEKNVLSMHCSANRGNKGDTAIFFGLSGTGKTTLSTDPERQLIGDDELGWNEKTIFNFEGGCYAKTIDLSPEKEPDIYNAIRFGSVVENVTFKPGTNTIDFASRSITENTRVSYPIDYIKNALIPSVGPIPENIFFLTADAYGVLPPISKLTPGQAMYHFISGYTAKIAGTENGIKEPRPTFSACFGAPFLPLHPTKYARMLGRKIKEHKTKIWLVNTGWTGGSFGVGSRMNLTHTRTMISAALEGELDNGSFHRHEIFGVMIPDQCRNIPSEILNPSESWPDKNAYKSAAIKLASHFAENFRKYAGDATEEMKAGGPQI